MPERQFTSSTAGVFVSCSPAPSLDASMAGEASLVLPNVTWELPIRMLLKMDLRTLVAI